MILRRKYLLYLFIAFTLITLLLFINSVFNGSLEYQRIFIILFLFSFLICLILVMKFIIDLSKATYKNYKEINLKIVDNKLIYNSDWIKDDYRIIEKIYFDIMINNGNLYLIKLPQNNVLLSYILFDSLFFHLISYLQKRDNIIIRSRWVDKNEVKIISDDYKQYISMVIPVSELNKAVLRKGNRLEFSYRNEKEYLRTTKKKMKLFLKKFIISDIEILN